jgi:hypothetical protein
MLDSLTLENFTPHVGGAFRLSTPDGTALTLTLDEVQSWHPLAPERTAIAGSASRFGCSSAARRSRSFRNASTRSSTRSWDAWTSSSSRSGRAVRSDFHLAGW